MIEVLSRLAFSSQRLHHAGLQTVFAVLGVALRHFNLLGYDHFTGSCVESKVHMPVRAVSNSFSPNPFEYGCYNIT